MIALIKSYSVFADVGRGYITKQFIELFPEIFNVTEAYFEGYLIYIMSGTDKKFSRRP